MMEQVRNHFEKLDFLNFLQSEASLTDAKNQRIKSAIDTSSHSIDVIITELGFVNEDDLLGLYSRYFKYDYLEGSEVLDASCAEQIGLHYLSARMIVPVQNENGKVKLAMADPFDNEAISTIEYFLDTTSEIILATRKQVSELLQIFEASIGELSPETFQDEVDLSNDLDMERLKDIAREAPVIQLANRIIEDGVDQSATDIHVEPWEDIVRVRFRIDGVLHDYENVHKSMQAGLSTRFKILSGMNISERRLPQDGRIRTSVRGQEIDFRVSSVPSIHGETIVIRILQSSTELLQLGNLGFDENAQATLDRIITIPNGIMLVTGPTGSGKTTTLYSMLSKLNDGKSKIFTVEDPVEYRLEGVTQLQIDAAIGLDFADTLRSVLRQDPDTILIGEIRDLETARIAIQAALTGHRVLATLHTNSAVGAITRLRDMGIDSFLLSATLRGVLSQRLVRKICRSCRNETTSTGCSECNETGFNGRTVIYEIFEVDTDASKVIGQGDSEDKIEVSAKQTGMVSIMNHADSLIKKSSITEAEVLRVTSFESSYG